VLWSAGHESGELSEYSQSYTDGEEASQSAQLRVTAEAAHGGDFGVEHTLSGLDAYPNWIATVLDWHEEPVLSGFFSAWFMFPDGLPTSNDVNGTLALLQIRRDEPGVGSREQSAIRLRDNGAGGVRLTFSNTPPSDPVYDIPPVEPVPALAAGRWFHLALYFTVHSTQGRLRVWVDNSLVWDLSDLDTRGDLTWEEAPRFRVGALGRGMLPNELRVFTDDAIVATRRGCSP
jgi:hypothetical protein